MLEKLLFIGAHHGLLALVLFSFFGWGHAALGRFLKASPPLPGLGIPLRISMGMGLWVVTLQVLGAVGQLTVAAVWVMVGAGALAAAWAAWERLRGPRTRRFLAGMDGSAWVLVAVVLGATVLAPLYPPRLWDELMYHLPHVRAWASHGGLTVNEWIRYPWFPYNLNLLYTAGYLIKGDVFTHLLHASMGWLVAAMLHALALRHGNRWTAALACLAWIALVLAQWQFSAAYVDMGVGLFVFSACLCFLHWLEHRDDKRWVAAAGFFLGVAVGSKYQALALVPLFLLGTACFARGIRPVLLLLAAMAVPCAYWYIRNAWMTGDPFNPLGGGVFGFHDWNRDDLLFQLADLKRSRDWPLWPVWFVLILPALKAVRRDTVLYCALVFSCFNWAVWAWTSHYSRYLVPAFPVLIFLSVECVRLTVLRFTRNPGSGVARLRPAVAARLKASVMACAVICSALAFGYQWTHLPVNDVDRHRYLSEWVDAYPLMQRLNGQPRHKTYQFDMEGLLYFSTQPLWGDHFGPWRYRDYQGLDAGALARKLAGQGFDSVLVRHKDSIESKTGWERFFVEADRHGDARYYRIVPP